MSASRKVPFRAFLLGETTDEEAKRIQAALERSESLRSSVRAAAAELIDAYVEGTLSTAEARQLEERYLPDPQGRRRVEFARVLVARARPEGTSCFREDGASWSTACRRPAGDSRPSDGGPEEAGSAKNGGASARSRRWSPLSWAGGGAAAAAALAVVLALGGPSSDLRPVPEVVRVSLAPAMTRSGGAGERAVEVPTRGRLEVELALDGARSGRGWSVRLVREGRTVWEGEPSASDAFGVTVAVPLDRIRPGRHVFELRRGRGPDARFLAEYPWVAASSPGSSRSS